MGIWLSNVPLPSNRRKKRKAGNQCDFYKGQLLAEDKFSIVLLQDKLGFAKGNSIFLMQHDCKQKSTTETQTFLASGDSWEIQTVRIKGQYLESDWCPSVKPGFATS